MGRKTIDVYTERYKKWAYKIDDNDPLSFDKKERIEAAVWLGYSDEVLTEIIKANSTDKISNIMTSVRLSA